MTSEKTKNKITELDIEEIAYYEGRVGVHNCA